MVDTSRTSIGGKQGIGDLFQLLRDGAAHTRAELTQLSGLSRSTIGNRIETLLATGLVAPAGEANSSGGRPPAQIAFNPRARVVLAVDLGATHAVVAVTDLQGEILASEREKIEIARGPEEVLEWVIGAAQRLFIEGQANASELVGVGIGLPGPVEHSTGRAINPPIMPGWDGFDVPGFIRRVYPVSILVDNDVNLLAVGEHTTVWPDAQDLFFVKVSTGIGAGIISGGKLQRGAQGTAGDLGHVRVPHSPDFKRSADDDRDLEALASGPAIAKELRKLGLDVHSSQDVVALVKAGNQDAIAATRQAGRYIGEVLATCVTLLNPSIIVIGGSGAYSGEHLLAGVREVVYRRSLPLATRNLTIVQSKGGELAGVLGAAIMVIQHVLSASVFEETLLLIEPQAVAP
jgi:predicted NBD/HSP70 family sugar kinase